MNKQEYKEYLQSDHWRQLRNAKRRKRRVVRCSIYDARTSDLRLLCRRCHFLAHDLMRTGKLKITSTSHHGMFSQLKYGVKKHLGIATKNMFR